MATFASQNSNRHSDEICGVALSWPADHIGWRLQTQINSISVGLSTNWLGVPNSTATNQVTYTIDPTAGGVFYRLIYP